MSTNRESTENQKAESCTSHMQAACEQNRLLAQRLHPHEGGLSTSEAPHSPPRLTQSPPTSPVAAPATAPGPPADPPAKSLPSATSTADARVAELQQQLILVSHNHALEVKEAWGRIEALHESSHALSVRLKKEVAATNELQTEVCSCVPRFQRTWLLCALRAMGA
jgi:hypothetical protein